MEVAVEHPESKVLPCVHRAPSEKPGGAFVDDLLNAN